MDISKLGLLFGRRPSIAPGGPDGVTAEGTEPLPAGDGAIHIGQRAFDRAPSRQMRAFDDMDQPPIGPVLVDPRHNLYMPSRYAMGWFGGLYPEQPLPAWVMTASAPSALFHVPLTDAQIKERSSKVIRGRGVQFPTAVVNPAQYLRHGGAAPIGIGPMQIQQFKVSTDATHQTYGNGPGSTYANAPFMAGGFAAET